MPPVIPGAPASFGMSTRAAYGAGTDPTIYKVTSLADSGAGTLRAALEASGPRVVIFETSGFITLSSSIVVSSPYVTIAGQTAPAPGITIRTSSGFGTDKTLYFSTHDILIQHLAIRPGGDSCNSAIQAYGGGQYNLIFDHISFSWGQDENLAFNWTSGQETNATMWRCFSNEGLLQAPGSGGCSGGGLANGHGLLVAASAGSVAVIQSLFASNLERNPYMQSDTRTVLLNNLIYQWHGPWGIFYSQANVAGGGPGPAWHSTVVGNRFVRGPNTGEPGSYMFVYSSNDFGFAGTSSANGNQIYRSDNTLANQDGTVTEQGIQYYDPNVGSPPSQAPMPVGYSPLASTAVEAWVLANAGSRPAERDAVDARVAATVTARSGNFISHPNDVGGYPSLATNTRALTTPANPHVYMANGYTTLEVWLQGYAAAVEGEAVDVVDRDLAAGRIFVNASFTGTAGLDLTAYTSEVGGGWTLQTGSTGVLELSNANRVLNTSVGVSGLTVALAVPVSGEYDVDADFRVLTLVSGSSYSIWGCTQIGSVTGYYAAYIVDAQSWQLGKVVNGTYADPVLGTYSQVLSINTTYHVTLLIREGGQELWVDGVHRIGATDTEITAMGRAGVSVLSVTTAATDTTGIHFDNFMATDVRDYPFVWPKGGGM